MARTVVARNKKARHDYFIIETYEAGIQLTGTEIKSVRAGKVNLKDGYARIIGSEVWLYNVHISPYEKGTYYNHDPLRPRKLLLRSEEIKRLIGKIKEKGLTLVPLEMYLKDNKWAKIELALVKGKTKHDKRESIAERDAKRAMEKALKRH
ncbi:SsrA-binding protein [Thermovirga lienii DSM 17291]|uniref:SsrA-binding protein n=1 Tax=Thermovirga lienii (strain ATCC BAA-1197 / DSM 17291 / Cas60314) TaxID=580340 RepID=G7V5P6_THELD|nr:SsrA-binding protein SmpB [Thermovirga lienii]AER66956.1 SsrA-binding protein [Thermovirga lienii DSM 17291]MDN5319068.1 SsrA-binding protein [Thermovirga sp.]MDN5367530.1 SsrA-binding protein [Thermovirga sp.]